VFRIRFMPASPGDYTWSATYQPPTRFTGRAPESLGRNHSATLDQWEAIHLLSRMNRMAKPEFQ